MMFARLLIVIACLSFGAWTHGAITNCPFGNSFDDGCPAAPIGGAFQRSNFFTSYALQSGQAAYQTRPPWNVAGVDYSVGYSSSSLPLKDPFGGVSCTNGNKCNMPTGCVLTSGRYFLCSGTSDILINGYDFSLNSGIDLRNNLNGGATLTITNNNFKRLSNNSADGSTISTVLGNTNNLVVRQNVFDGNCSAFPSGFTSLVSHAGATGTFTSEYNAYLNSASSITQTDSTGNRIERFNYGEGMVCTNAGIHASWPSTQTGSGTIPIWTFDFNTALSLAVPFGNTGITAFAEVGCNGCTGMTVANVRNNTMVANRTTGTINATMGYLSTIQSVVVGTANFIQNYVDPTGILGSSCFSFVAGGSASTLVQTGNINLLNASSIGGFSAPCYGHF